MRNQPPKPFDNPSIVQFIHPGRECSVNDRSRAKCVEVPWVVDRHKCKCNDHSRRLICSAGDFVGEDGKLKTGDMTFWGEWEACTTALKMPETNIDRNAHWVHFPKSPFYGGSAPNLLNTDPCVFGEKFKYCICQQSEYGAMRRLKAGSLILFGTHVKGGSSFFLDTVFVTAENGIPYECANSSNLTAVSKEYRELTLKRLHSGKGTYYRSATFHSPSKSGMYSFVPARRFVKDNPFCGERCQLDISCLNSHIPLDSNKKLVPDLPRKFKNMETDPETVRKVWDDVLRQVIAQKFVPAVHFDWPK